MKESGLRVNYQAITNKKNLYCHLHLQQQQTKNQKHN